MARTVFREFHYRWEWQLKSTPEALWPLVSDTNIFNRDTGVPAVEHLQPGSPEENQNNKQHLRLRRLGIPIEWEEEPFEWVRPYKFGVMRRYMTGPVAYMRVLAEMSPVREGGTKLVYQVWARPRTALGLAAIPAQIGVLGARSFDAAFRKYDQMVAKRRLPVDIPAHVQFAPGGQERLEALKAKLRAQVSRPELVDKLAGVIEKSDDLSVARIRPYALADHWGEPRRDVLELCLWATRLGLLDFRWDVLCPLCRGSKESGSSLKDVSEQVHCDNCNINFNINFDRFVELTFKPNPAVREINVGEFCVGGPQVTPHIIVQQLLKPGQARRVPVPLEPGRYRMRTMKLSSGQVATAAPGGVSEATFRAREDGWSHEEIQLGTNPALTLENATGEEQLFIFERMAWTDQAVTAAEVTMLQTFRDLFSTEALRPGDQISVGSLAVLFTDLHSSTRIYREVGDATAFGMVMDHFDVLKESIVDEDGVLVKNIGDAIMAVFRQPAPALRAILKAQDKLANPPEGVRPLILKAGIHFGPAIAVTMNDRLDYFGSTVNMAARLERQSLGGDVVISDAVSKDPQVAAILADHERGLHVETFQAALKGFEESSFELCRVINLRVAGKHPGLVEAAEAIQASSH